jgi:tRNA(fMet)-specific endonuclease VapC
MLVLDTDHLTEYQKGTAAGLQLKHRLEQTFEPYATTIITVEEMMRGWMAAIRRIDDPTRQIAAYSKLQRLFQFFSTWKILEWDVPSVNHFLGLRRSGVRIGTMDLKIASIALANNAKLLTRNAKDFDRVPDLDSDDWLS